MVLHLDLRDSGLQEIVDHHADVPLDRGGEGVLAVGELRRDDEVLGCCEKGGWATFKAPRCRVGDKVFFVESTGRGAADGGAA